MAAVGGISKYHFTRCFQAAYGETPIRYLTRRRIERAQDLMRGANLTITETCMAVGFSSMGSFSSRFRQIVGETPTAYRDRWAARGGPHVPVVRASGRAPLLLYVLRYGDHPHTASVKRTTDEQWPRPAFRRRKRLGWAA